MTATAAHERAARRALAGLKHVDIPVCKIMHGADFEALVNWCMGKCGLLVRMLRVVCGLEQGEGAADMERPSDLATAVAAIRRAAGQQGAEGAVGASMSEGGDRNSQGGGDLHISQVGECRTG